MIELIKFELEKIFRNKGLYIAALAVFIFIAGIDIVRCVKFKEDIGSREEVQEIAENYLSDSYSKKDIEKLRNEGIEKLNNNEELTKEEHLLNVYSNCFVKSDDKSVDNRLDFINEKLSDMEENNKKDDFQYNSITKQKELLEALPEKEGLYIGDWRKVLDLNVAATMKMLLLTLGLAGIFSKEYSTRVSYINLSSKNGKTKLNTAKIISVFIYSTIVFAFVTVVFLISTIYLGLPNGDKPYSFISRSIYNLSINEYYLGSLAFSYLGTLVFGLIIALTSLLTKNIIASFIVPISLYLLPMFVKLSGSIGYVWSHINFAEIFSGKNILEEYADFNILGNVVTYPYVISFISILSIIVMIIVYMSFGKKQKIA